MPSPPGGSQRTDPRRRQRALIAEISAAALRRRTGPSGQGIAPDRRLGRQVACPSTQRHRGLPRPDSLSATPYPPLGVLDMIAMPVYGRPKRGMLCAWRAAEAWPSGYAPTSVPMAFAHALLFDFTVVSQVLARPEEPMCLAEVLTVEHWHPKGDGFTRAVRPRRGLSLRPARAKERPSELGCGSRLS